MIDQLNKTTKHFFRYEIRDEEGTVRDSSGDIKDILKILEEGAYNGEDMDYLTLCKVEQIPFYISKVVKVKIDENSNS
jgi:hypothetical protein